MSLISLGNIIRFYVEQSLLRHGWEQKCTTAIFFLLVSEFLRHSVFYLIKCRIHSVGWKRATFSCQEIFWFWTKEFNIANGRATPIAHLPNPILQQMRFALRLFLHGAGHWLPRQVHMWFSSGQLTPLFPFLCIMTFCQVAWHVGS